MALVRLKRPQPRVRQTAMSGPYDDSGSFHPLDPDFITSSSLDLNTVNLTTTPLVVTFAAGFDSAGPIDYTESISTNTSSAFTSLPANQISYLYLNRANNGTITYGHTIIPPIYPMNGVASGMQTSRSLLHFEGADTSTTFSDDYNSSSDWSAAGNAQIDTAQFKFGSASLLLDGTGDYIAETVTTGKGSLSWTTECWVRWNSLPGTNTTQTIYSATNGAGFGINMQLNNTSGTTKTRLILSSNGTSGNIANSTLGTKTTWSTGTWYHFALTFDQLAGKYILYVDGTQDQSITSSALICSFTKQRIGDNGAGASQMNGWIDEFRNSSCCRYPNGTTFTPSASAFTVDGHAHDVSGGKMYEATSAFGSFPSGLTARQRVFVAEVSTNASAVTSLRYYAYNAQVYSYPQDVPSSTSRSTYDHNIGVFDVTVEPILINNITEEGYTAYEKSDYFGAGATGTAGSNKKFDFNNHYQFSLTVQGAQPSIPSKSSTGTTTALTNADWKVQFIIKRAW